MDHCLGAPLGDAGVQLEREASRIDQLAVETGALKVHLVVEPSRCGPVSESALRDTPRTMSEESTTPDLVELTRRTFEAGSRHDVEAALSFYAPDAVMDLTDGALGYFEGTDAIAGFLQDWWGTWGEHLIEVEESVDLGHGVVFSRVSEDGRLAGSDGHVQQSRGWVLLWVEGVISRATAYLDIDEARAAAERLAQERG